MLYTFLSGFGMSVGQEMQRLNKEQQPMMILRKKLLDFSDPQQGLARLMFVISHMVNFSPVDRVDVTDVKRYIEDIKESGMCKVPF